MGQVMGGTQFMFGAGLVLLVWAAYAIGRLRERYWTDHVTCIVEASTRRTVEAESVNIRNHIERTVQSLRKGEGYRQ